MEESSHTKHTETSCSTTVDSIFKVIILGDSCVGKTCLAYRFSTGRFPRKTEVTIGVDFFEKVFELGGETIKLQLWDTAGQERFRRSMISHYYRNVHAVIFMYDITRKASFESLPNWLEECNHHVITNEVPRVLIGNKCDLSNERVVNSNFARKFADIHNMPLWEISARNDHEMETINSIFLTLVHKLKAHKPMMVFPPQYCTTNWQNLQFDKMQHIYQPCRQGSIKKLPVKKETEKEKKKCACS